MGHPDTTRGRVANHELALVTLGIITALALAISSSGSSASFEAFAATLSYGIVICACHRKAGNLGQRVCFLASFLFVTWFYFAIARITPALGSRLRDKVLLTLDRALFGHTPAVYLDRYTQGWLTDLMSLCYMTYHFYLGLVVLHAIGGQKYFSKRLSTYLFTGFVAGFSGYLLVPAVGPVFAYPELFGGPLPGGAISKMIAEIVRKGSSVYDAFPSLHVLITCILLDYDWGKARLRFWFMLLPSIGLVISTIYLRYHYGIDILIAILLFLVIRKTFLKPIEEK